MITRKRIQDAGQINTVVHNYYSRVIFVSVCLCAEDYIGRLFFCLSLCEGKRGRDHVRAPQLANPPKNSPRATSSATYEAVCTPIVGSPSVHIKFNTVQRAMRVKNVGIVAEMAATMPGDVSGNEGFEFRAKATR